MRHINKEFISIFYNIFTLFYFFFQLLVIDFAEFRNGVINVQYDIVERERRPNPSPSLKGREDE